jgi:hypothetical protein
MLSVTGGRERTATQLGALFDSAGFRLTRVIETAGAMRLIEGVVG